MGVFEDKYLEFQRRGAIDKIKWMERIDKAIMPSLKKRIQQNDKTVLRELVLPAWVNWEMLYDWATSAMAREGKNVCVLCTEFGEGVNFKGKHVCWTCFNEMKAVQQKVE